MFIDRLKARDFISEMKFSSSRSSGPGGQNVNKVNTRIELRFNINNSRQLTDSEKRTILNFPSTRLTKDGELLFSSQATRSQYKNKEDAIDNFFSYLSICLKPRRKRKATKPSHSSIEKRLSGKKRISELKRNRRRPEF